MNFVEMFSFDGVLKIKKNKNQVIYKLGAKMYNAGFVIHERPDNVKQKNQGTREVVYLMKTSPSFTGFYTNRLIFY